MQKRERERRGDIGKTDCSWVRHKNQKKTLQEMVSAGFAKNIEELTIIIRMN